jgi:hypothetical protein
MVSDADSYGAEKSRVSGFRRKRSHAHNLFTIVPDHDPRRPFHFGENGGIQWLPLSERLGKAGLVLAPSKLPIHKDKAFAQIGPTAPQGASSSAQ